ncbi:peptidase M24A, methionine aminopeptidase [Didymella exigua CBS 183.55]|uniref:Peptidase M24A, methionine aminopeptidase n=1 Tax=Didymella exigua CBS 183.55 TaxID=1150837 RepID=A0A6A5RYP7_9PLEO|nr:peptidase M24A, methionine aminopeptidase [Didymella exigua CBS 183.55]KAF1933575.1 peptidase M24A, methionine aminopeptidase [Didymella exigua CBS 183.55]
MNLPRLTLKYQKQKRKRNKGKKKPSATHQTSPPRVPLEDVFKSKPFPEGQSVDYNVRDENLQRKAEGEVRHLAAVNDMDDNFLSDYRKAAEVHRQLADEIKDGVRALVGHQAIEIGDALKAGMGFPTGLCLNNVAAHWTPSPGQKNVALQYDDFLSFDFGVHVNGRIVDSAFTIIHNPIYDGLLEGVKAASDTGLNETGIDARMDHISACIQEVMESYEILRYKIHGDKQVPFVKTCTNQTMKEGDIFAIETFGSTGRGSIRDAPGVYGYGLTSSSHINRRNLHHASARSLLKVIEENFGTLVFSRRYLERLGVDKYHLGMKTLVEKGVVVQYAPLVDVSWSYVAHFEHTVLLRLNYKEVISRGDDY